MFGNDGKFYDPLYDLNRDGVLDPGERAFREDMLFGGYIMSLQGDNVDEDDYDDEDDDDGDDDDEDDYDGDDYDEDDEDDYDDDDADDF